MARPTALSQEQQQQVASWFAAGATIPEAHRRARAMGWKVAQSTIATYQFRGAPAAAAASPAPGAGEGWTAPATAEEAHRRALAVALQLAENPRLEAVRRLDACGRVARLLEVRVDAPAPLSTDTRFDPMN